MKKNSALYFSVGLAALLAVVILVFGMFFLNEKDPRETFNTFYLRFSQVSTLVLDDPVKVNGVKMGKVEDISLAGHRVVVRIRLRTDVKIPKDSEIRVQNIGIMGERQIGMILGDAESYWAPGDTINGQFDAGIAEALGLAGEVCDSTKVLLESVKEALNGTIANPDFQERFRTILAKAESQLSGGMRQRAALLRTYLNSQGVALLDEPFSALDMITKRHIHGWYQDVMAKIRLSTLFITHDVDEAILLSDRALHDDLVKTIHSADSLFRVILHDGLDINVDIF